MRVSVIYPANPDGPVEKEGNAYLADFSGRPILPDEMQQIIFTIIEDDGAFLWFGVNEIGAIASKCATGFESQDESLSVGIFHRTGLGGFRSAAVLELER